MINMKKHTIGKKNICIIRIFLVIICFISVYIEFERIKDKNTHLEKECINLPFDTKECRKESIDKLTSILIKEKDIRLNTRNTLVSKISRMYILNADYVRALEYSMESVYIAQQLGESHKEAKSLIDMSSIFVDLNKFDTAKKIIHKALELNNHSEIKIYAYINLAEIYSKINEGDLSIEYIDKARRLIKKSVSFYDLEIIGLNIIEARALLCNKQIHKSEQKLDEIEEKVYNYKNKLVMEVKIPYLSLRSKLEIAKGNLQKGIQISDELFRVCEEEGIGDIKKNYMDYIVRVLHKYYEQMDMKKDNINEQQILDEYNSILTNKSDVLLEFIINKHTDKFQALDARQDKLKIVVLVCVILSMAIILCATVCFLNKYKKQIELDALTHIYNRRKFDFDYKMVSENNEIFGIIMVDIDYFKRLNDNYGHAFGDVVLAKVAKNIKNMLSKNEKVFRYGGEEFCILSVNRSLDDMSSSADAIRKMVEQMVWQDDMVVTISLGVAHSNLCGDVFKKADENLYKAKNQGRNRVCCER